MKRLYLLACFLCSPVSAASASSFDHLADACVPEAPLRTLRPLVRVESAFRPNAMSVNYPQAVAKKLGYPSGHVSLDKQPRSQEQALAWTNRLAARGITVSLGLMQVNTEEAAHWGIGAQALLETCTNLRVGWSIFRRYYAAAARRYGPGQTALKESLSLYNTGQFEKGFQNGYVDSIVHPAAHR